MNLTPETEKQIQELQIYEQALQNFLMQKQTLDVEIGEINNAINELKKSGDEVYKILGSVMLKADKETLSKELSEKKKLLELRISSVEKQGKLIEDKAEKLKKEINQSISKEK